MPQGNICDAKIAVYQVALCNYINPILFGMNSRQLHFLRLSQTAFRYMCKSITLAKASKRVLEATSFPTKASSSAGRPLT